MPNERLRAVMASGGWTHGSLAEAAGVDPKSVERWVNLGRTPRQATALKAAETLGEDVHALWPALRQARAARAVSPELVALYDQGADLPVSVFVDLLAAARERIDVLVYAAVFLHEAYPRLNDLLRERAAEGCAVRIAVGDADSENVQQRGREEEFGQGLRAAAAWRSYITGPCSGYPASSYGRMTRPSTTASIALMIRSWPTPTYGA